MNTLSPVGLKTKEFGEFGEAGRGFAPPTDAFPAVKKYAEVTHADGISAAHPSLEARTPGAPGAPEITPEIAAVGESGI